MKQSTTLYLANARLIQITGVLSINLTLEPAVISGSWDALEKGYR